MVNVGRVLVELAIDVRRADVDAGKDVLIVLAVNVRTDGLSLASGDRKF